jgi:hypothetical protein
MLHAKHKAQLFATRSFISIATACTHKAAILLQTRHPQTLRLVCGGDYWRSRYPGHTHAAADATAVLLLTDIATRSPVLICAGGSSGLPSCFFAAVIRVVAVLHLCSWLLSAVGPMRTRVELLKHQCGRFVCCRSTVLCGCILAAPIHCRVGVGRQEHHRSTALHSNANRNTPSAQPFKLLCHSCSFA